MNPGESKNRQPKNTRPPLIHSTRFHLVLYSFLLVATPFLLVTNFLQSAIERLSLSRFPVGDLSVPIIPTIVALLLVTLLAALRSRLTRLRLAAGLAGLLMVALAQQVADYYYDHHFYELQQNWHYIAYALFAFIMYRDLDPRGIPLPRIMRITFLCALSFSAFDEVFQMRLSSRVFDVGDIAKDVWGSLIGMAILYLGGRHGRSLRSHFRRVRHPRLGGYLQSPSSTFLLLLVFSFLFLYFASLLTDHAYWWQIVLFTISSAVPVYLIFHLSQHNWARRILLALVIAAGVCQSYFFIKYRSEQIVHHRYGLTIYKGIPIPFFDVMIFPNGMFRLVDKKHFFRDRDRAFLLKQRVDIILIGSGIEGRGGKGFPEQGPSQFVFNRFSRRASQVIILRNREACSVFNRLKAQGKRVLFVLHNTC